MKIKRRKVAKKILKTYTSHFGFSEPYKLLIDGTFAKRALDNKVRIDDQVKNYFGKNIKLYTTECVINELTVLGKQLYGALCICKKMEIYDCGHKGSKMAKGCLKHIIEKGNEDKFFIATNDKQVSSFANSIPGTPLVYIVGNTIVLDKPSENTSKAAEADLRAATDLTTHEQKILKQIRMEEKKIAPVLHKRKVIKGPNPLSMKKKSTAKEAKTGAKPAEEGESSKNGNKKSKKRRVKLSAHAKMAVLAKMKELTA
ncbi:unnamed protein product [Oikopleura dioica]|uniref:rRNA-processing protein UTP23 homolog n=1 Tax=Oikopleura dioica TaxID=34765 RepID=E4WYW6_OIKDI|nr:unnamed protein product [Oikopleura dioica]